MPIIVKWKDPTDEEPYVRDVTDGHVAWTDSRAAAHRWEDRAEFVAATRGIHDAEWRKCAYIRLVPKRKPAPVIRNVAEQGSVCAAAASANAAGEDLMLYALRRDRHEIAEWADALAARSTGKTAATYTAVGAAIRAAASCG